MTKNRQIKKNISLAQYSSWLVGGHAEYYVAPETVSELSESIEWAKEEGHEITILSGGTNVLISDQGISGLTVHLRKLSGLEISESGGDLKIVAYAGTSKAKVLKEFLKRKLSPSLFLAGLPGDIGGGVTMNAGVGESYSPREFCEIVEWVEVLDMKDSSVRKMSSSELEWSYRSCLGWQPGVITRVGMSWPLEPIPSIINEVKAANQSRLKKQPLEFPSCGSVFRNPPGGKAGQLIEECGLKGFRIGGAMVSEKHANFIINAGNARAADIRAVIEHVKNAVKTDKGFELNTEVVFLGES